MRLMPTALPRTSAPPPGAPDDAPGLVVTVVTLPDGSAGETLCVGRFDSPVGPLIVMGAGGVIWGLGLAAELGEAAVRADLARRSPGARSVEAPEALAPAVTALLAGRGEVRVRLAGTAFQSRVWRELLQVRPGEVVTYAALAAAIGQPGASRAVGTAVGLNPVAWLVPCHRVVRASGGSGGYHWGGSVKRALLAREVAQV